VHRVFSDVYRTTIGVTIEKKRIRCDEREVSLVIWDLTGEDEFQSVNLAYMRGASGILTVVDGTRRATAEVALRLRANARASVGDVPSVIVLNKCDLVGTWEIDEAIEAALRRAGVALVKTSAKTGAGVEEAFCALARAIAIEPDRESRGV
jgi:small GTP-binding protein